MEENVVQLQEHPYRVVGTYSRRGIRHLVLGSVADAGAFQPWGFVK